MHPTRFRIVAPNRRFIRFRFRRMFLKDDLAVVASVFEAIGFGLATSRPHSHEGCCLNGSAVASNTLASLLVFLKQLALAWPLSRLASQ